MPAKHTQARALVDIPAHGARCGGLIDAPADVIAALVAAGAADTHPEAIRAAIAVAGDGAAQTEDPTGRPAVKRTRPTKPAAASDAGDPTPKD